MKRWLCGAILVWIGGTALADDAARKVADPVVGFSYTAPAGWVTRDLPGTKSPIAFGTPHDGFAPNINVVEEGFPGSLDDYVRQNLESMAKILPGFKKLGVSDFQTNSGLKGKKVQCLDSHQGKALSQTFYFLPGRPGKMLVVTCSTLDVEPATTQPLFDGALKSFAVQP